MRQVLRDFFFLADAYGEIIIKRINYDLRLPEKKYQTDSTI
jgi:hypothetical protein